MRIGLIDVDSHNFPNLALMKLSAWHKEHGEDVEWCSPLEHYDRVYQSKVFSDDYSPDIDWHPDADEVIKGGTGYGLTGELPREIEHQYPDYSLYPKLTKDTAYGFLTRGCPRHCSFCIVGDKEGLRSRKVADLSEFWEGQGHIKLLDQNLLACRERYSLLGKLVDCGAKVDFTQGLDIRLTGELVIDYLNAMRIENLHFAWDNPMDNLYKKFERYASLAERKHNGNWATVYVLVNYQSTLEEDLMRIYALRELGYMPYVMVYDKTHAPKMIRRMQRWVNNKIIFKSCERFEDYEG